MTFDVSTGTLLSEGNNKKSVTEKYDNMGRVIETATVVDSGATVKQTYQYTVGNGDNFKIITMANGYQTKTQYDGLGRIIATFSQKLYNGPRKLDTKYPLNEI